MSWRRVRRSVVCVHPSFAPGYQCSAARHPPDEIENPPREIENPPAAEWKQTNAAAKRPFPTWARQNDHFKQQRDSRRSFRWIPRDNWPACRTSCTWRRRRGPWKASTSPTPPSRWRWPAWCGSSTACRFAVAAVFHFHRPVFDARSHPAPATYGQPRVITRRNAARSGQVGADRTRSSSTPHPRLNAPINGLAAARNLPRHREYGQPRVIARRNSARSRQVPADRTRLSSWSTSGSL